MLPTSRDDFATKKSRNQRKTVANIGYLSELDKYLLGKILILTLGEEGNLRINAYLCAVIICRM